MAAPARIKYPGFETGARLFGRKWSVTIGLEGPKAAVTPPELTKVRQISQQLLAMNQQKSTAAKFIANPVLNLKSPLSLDAQKKLAQQNLAAANASIPKLQTMLATAQKAAAGIEVTPAQEGVAIEIKELDIQFKIEKSTEDEPNKCELKVWNLSEQIRAQIAELVPITKSVPATAKGKVKKAARKQATTGIPIRIEAGYEDTDLSLLWIGDLRTAISTYEKPDWVTSFESGDGEKAWQNARVHVSYGPKTPKDVALRAIVRALGVGEGNLAKFAQSLRLTGATYKQGTVISGPAGRALSDICRSADLEYSIQDGAIQFLDRGAALAQKAILVSEETGMIGSPTVDVDGIMKVKMLLVPDIRPGRLVQLDTRQIEGAYRIDKVTYQGDTAGSDWTAELVCSRY